MKKLANLFKTSHVNKLIAVATCLVVIVVGFLVVHSKATSFFASATPETGVVSGGATVATDNSSAIGGKYIRFASSQGSGGGGTTTGLWMPTASQPLAFHWVLGSALNVNDPVQMGLRDFNGNTLPAPQVYDIDGEYNTKATVDYLHSQGKKVICYFDAGVYETYRSDASAFPKSVIGSPDNGWDGSYWLDIRQVDILKPIMQARMQMCKDKGFDSIEPDEITNWSNNPGFPITYQDQITYNRDVASWAHAVGLSIGLKGDLEQAHDLVSNFDWSLNEECFQYNECTTVNNSGGPGADGKDYPGLQLFVQQNKAVWVAEYKAFTDAKWSSICATSQQQHFNTSEFKLGLPNNGGRKPCPTTSATQW
jgi:hypothetical protein